MEYSAGGSWMNAAAVDTLAFLRENTFNNLLFTNIFPKYWIFFISEGDVRFARSRFPKFPKFPSKERGKKERKNKQTFRPTFERWLISLSSLDRRKRGGGGSLSNCRRCTTFRISNFCTPIVFLLLPLSLSLSHSRKAGDSPRIWCIRWRGWADGYRTIGTGRALARHWPKYLAAFASRRSPDAERGLEMPTYSARHPPISSSTPSLSFPFFFFFSNSSRSHAPLRFSLPGATIHFPPPPPPLFLISRGEGNSISFLYALLWRRRD